MVYMHNLVAVPENDTHKLLFDFDIHTDHLIPAQNTRLNNNQRKKRELAK